MYKDNKYNPDTKSPGNEKIWDSERGSILDDFLKIKQLVDNHYKIRSKDGRPDEKG